MGKKIVTFFMLVLTVFVGRTLFIVINQSTFIGDVCRLEAPSSGEGPEQAFRKKFFGCQTVKGLKLAAWTFNCDKDVKRPNCKVTDDTKNICRMSIERGLEKKSQDDCELDYTCPEDLVAYQKLLDNCHKK